MSLSDSLRDTDRNPSASPFLLATEHIEKWEPLDQLDEVMSKAGAAASRPGLRGDWLGHALHPMLTDLPLGMWMSAAVLDLIGGKSSRRAAQRLVGGGVLAAVPTAAAGLSEWESLPHRASRRVATVHAVGNTLVLGLYLRSWLARRSGRQATGVVWGLAGGVLAIVTGYLGGHLSFTLGVGMGERGGPGAGERERE